MSTGSRSRKPGELLVDPRSPGRNRRRARRRARASVQRSSASTSVAVAADRVGRAPQVPARQHVGERVVVDGLVILVGADHAVEVRAPGAVDTDARRPVARGLDERGEPGAGRERCRRPSSRRSSSAAHATSPTMCTSASPVRIGTTSTARCRADRGVASRPKPRPTPTETARRGDLRAVAAASAAGSRWHAVLEHRPRRRRMGRGKEREHEQIGVPEHVAAVARGRSARARRPRLRQVGDRRHQMEQRKPRMASCRCSSPSMRTSAAPSGVAHARRCSPNSGSNPAAARVREAPRATAGAFSFDAFDGTYTGDAIEVAIRVGRLLGRNGDRAACRAIAVHSGFTRRSRNRVERAIVPTQGRPRLDHWNGRDPQHRRAGPRERREPHARSSSAPSTCSPSTPVRRSSTRHSCWSRGELRAEPLPAGRLEQVRGRSFAVVHAPRRRLRARRRVRQSGAP